jgi:hypothetical protein
MKESTGFFCRAVNEPFKACRAIRKSFACLKCPLGRSGHDES